MNSHNFSAKYWDELKPIVSKMISEAPLHSDKQQYVRECWKQLETELRKYDLIESEYLSVFAKLRGQIEDKILK